jgi:hypothetical protein
MCKVIHFNEYRGNKADQERKRIAKGNDTKGEVGKVRQAKRGAEKKNTGGLSTEALIKEFVQNGRSVLKLVLYIIEQYGCIGENGSPFEEVKRDVKYCEICPEIENKRMKAPLAVRIGGEWHAVEVVTNSSSNTAFWKKWKTIGDYNMKGFCVDVSGINRGDMKYFLSEKHRDFCLKEIVENIHRFYLNGKSIFHFERKSVVEINGEDTCMTCIYKMKELFSGFVILEGTEADTGAMHMVLLCKGGRKREYAEYYIEEYADAGIPLFYVNSRYGITENWKSDMMSYNPRTIYRSLEEIL